MLLLTRTIILAAIAFLHFEQIPAQLTIEGYYWRDYYNAIPIDAYPGGTDVNGQHIYIGQALVDTRLFVTKIYDNTRKAYYGLFGKAYEATKNMKILCSQIPSQFIWVPTTTNSTNLLTGRHLVRGGYEPDFPVFIGRIQNKGETTIGKVTGRGFLYIVENDKEIPHSTYEILTYNISHVSTDYYPIDIRIES